MNAKKYLEQIKIYKYQIEQDYLRIQELYTILESGAIDYSKDKVQVSPTKKMEDIVIQITELKEKRLAKIQEMENYIAEAEDKIKQLNNKNYIEVLTERFINLKRYEIISEEMHKENQTIRKICSAALKRFDELHKEFLSNRQQG